MSTAPERIYADDSGCWTTEPTSLDAPLHLRVWPNEAGYVREDIVEELVGAAQVVPDGLNARIDAAPSTALPVFEGIAALHTALNRAAQP
jgi:hypothetical protein